MDVPTEVIEACQQGSPEAFEQLVRLTQREVYMLALRLTGNPDDAAEVTQEVYIRLLRSIRTFRGEAKFSTWLYRVTSSVAITALRKRARRRHEVPLEEQRWEDWKGSAADEPEPELERRELADRLEGALAALPEGYRSVVVLRDVYGLTLAEVGEQVGISEGAAKVRLFRARQKLMELLKDEELNHEDQAAPRKGRRTKRRAGQGSAGPGVGSHVGRDGRNGMS